MNFLPNKYVRVSGGCVDVTCFGVKVDSHLRNERRVNHENEETFPRSEEEIMRRRLEAIDSQSVIQTVALKLVIKVGQLLDEALVGVDVAMHTNGPDRFDGRHFPRNHQIRKHTGCRTRHADHTVDEDFSWKTDKT